MSRKVTRKAKPLRAARGGSQSRKTQYKAYPQYTMYNSPRMVMPPEYDTVLRYTVQDVVTNAGGVRASIRFGTNAYDVDPTLASTAMPGFAEFAQFYARFRTLAIKYKFSAANQEAFNITVIHGFSNSAIASGSVNIEYAGNPLMKTAILGPLTGQNRGTFTQKATVAKITGTQQPLFDDLYTGSTTSSTMVASATKWAYFALISPVVMTAAGVLVTVEIDLTIRFYLPNWLQS